MKFTLWYREGFGTSREIMLKEATMREIMNYVHRWNSFHAEWSIDGEKFYKYSASSNFFA